MIELKDITPDNHLAVRALCVRADQSRFVADVDKSLADAFVWKDALVKAGCRDGIPFGFVMIFPFRENSLLIVNIVRLLVDAKDQGKGLGRELLDATIRWIDTLGADRIRISTAPDNNVALSLYKGTGFVEGEIEDGELTLYLERGVVE